MTNTTLTALHLGPMASDDSPHFQAVPGIKVETDDPRDD